MPPRLNFLASFRALALHPGRRAAPTQWPQPRSLAVVRRYSDQTPTTPPTPPFSTIPPPRPPPSAYSGPGEDYGDVALASLDASRPLDEPEQVADDGLDNDEALRQLRMMSYGLNAFDVKAVGHKYGAPELPIPQGMHHRHRYHPALMQVTNLLMRDGKKSKAQRDMAMVLNFLRTSPAPRVSPVKPLLAGAPPPAALPLDPIAYLTLALDSVAPLIKIRYFSGLAGGGATTAVPFPLAIRQRRRIAFMWILDLVNKKTSQGSGRTQLAKRIADEIIAIIEGRSSLWEKRQAIHRTGTASRANLTTFLKKR